MTRCVVSKRKGTRNKELPASEKQAVSPFEQSKQAFRIDDCKEKEKEMSNIENNNRRRDRRETGSAPPHFGNARNAFNFRNTQRLTNVGGTLEETQGSTYVRRTLGETQESTDVRRTLGDMGEDTC